MALRYSPAALARSFFAAAAKPRFRQAMLSFGFECGGLRARRPSPRPPGRDWPAGSRAANGPGRRRGVPSRHTAVSRLPPAGKRTRPLCAFWRRPGEPVAGRRVALPRGVPGEVIQRHEALLPPGHRLDAAGQDDSLGLLEQSHFGERRLVSSTSKSASPSEGADLGGRTRSTPSSLQRQHGPRHQRRWVLGHPLFGTVTNGSRLAPRRKVPVSGDPAQWLRCRPAPPFRTRPPRRPLSPSRMAARPARS